MLIIEINKLKVGQYPPKNSAPIKRPVKQFVTNFKVSLIINIYMVGVGILAYLGITNVER